MYTLFLFNIAKIYDYLLHNGKTVLRISAPHSHKMMTDEVVLVQYVIIYSISPCAITFLFAAKTFRVPVKHLHLRPFAPSPTPLLLYLYVIWRKASYAR